MAKSRKDPTEKEFFTIEGLQESFAQATTNKGCVAFADEMLTELKTRDDGISKSDKHLLVPKLIYDKLDSIALKRGKVDVTFHENWDNCNIVYTWYLSVLQKEENN